MRGCCVALLILPPDIKRSPTACGGGERLDAVLPDGPTTRGTGTSCREAQDAPWPTPAQGEFFYTYLHG
jgi:hypothetical protein